jgi:uncharacterized protein (TIGR00266 family)
MKENESNLQFEFHGQPDYAMATIKIPKGTMLKVEASAMASMDSNISMKTKMRGGLSRMFTGESIFINEFTADGSDGEINIVPAPPGDMKHVYLEGPDDVVYLQNSAFVASGPDVKVESKWQGMIKGFFSGHGLFLIRCSGPGDLWFNSYGAIVPMEIDGDYVVDTGHVVGFTDGLNYKVEMIKGFKSFFLSKEGLICRFSGQGKAWIQTRKVLPFVSWLSRFRPQKKG